MKGCCCAIYSGGSKSCVLPDHTDLELIFRGYIHVCLFVVVVAIIVIVVVIVIVSFF